MNYEFFLLKGWNLVSFFQIDIDFNQLISNKNILEIKSSNRSYNRQIPIFLNTLKKIELGKGYWFYLSDNSKININGNKNIKDIKINLIKGWNLVGYPFNVKKNINTLPSNITNIKSLSKSYHSEIIKELNTLKYFETGEAYLIKSNEAKEFIFKYPYQEGYLNDNNEIFGLFAIKELNILDSFNKVEYIVNTHNYQVSYDGDLNKYQYYHSVELDQIINNLNQLRFNIYFGKLNGDNVIGGIEFLTNFKVFNNYNGNISIDNSLYNDELKLVILRFNNSQKNKIILNIVKEKITLIQDGLHFVINLSIINSKNSNLKINPESEFLYDFDFNKIKLDDIKILKNYDLLKIGKVDSKVKSEILEVSCYSEDLISINFEKVDIIDKSLKSTLVINGIVKESKIMPIIKNEKFTLSYDNILYEFLIDWEGELNIPDENLLSTFVSPNYYLYWYDLNTVTFDIFNINNSSKNYSYEIEYTEKNKDYIVFNFDLSDDKYYFILIKDSKIKGCINIYFRNNDITDILKWSVYSNKKFKLNNNLEIKLGWKGDYDKLGYSILNTKVDNQREIGLSLNSYKIIKYKDFSIKIHYMIGDNKDSIDLVEWKSYKNYLDKLESIIKYTIDYVKLFDLLFPLKEYQIIKNGGSSDYDVYVTEIENHFVKGYTAAESYAYHTENHDDVITYMVLSNKLTNEWLDTVFLHEFFHSIQGSYDWFDSKWVAEGLATAFEYTLTNYSELSPRYFISDFLGKRNLSLKFDKNFTINRGIFKSYNVITKDNIVGNIILYLEEIYVSDSKIDISRINLNDLTIYSYENYIKIVNIEVVRYFNSYLLKIKLESKERINYFNLLYKNNIISNVTSGFRGRYYGSFTFFSYLFDKYNIKYVLKSIMKNTISYDDESLLDKTIGQLTSNSGFMKELIDFWCSIEILSSNENVIERYRLKNAEQWKKYFINEKKELSKSKGPLIINDLESTGSHVIDINFEGKKSISITVEPENLINLLYFRFIINYNNNQFDVREVDSISQFDININENVNYVKIITIADVNFPSNKDFIIKLDDQKKNKLQVKNTFDFFIRVQPN